MFNGGAVVFNTSPFINLALREQAKKQAKDEAIDRYLIDQSKAVTPTGMRAKDIEGGWAQKAQRWQQLGIEGKKYIANPALDGYKTINEFNRLKNELLADAERSKQVGKDEDTLTKLRLEGKWNPTDEDLGIANDISLSIYDPNRKNHGLNDLSVNRPPFDPAKFTTDLQTGRKRGRIAIGDPEYDTAKGIMREHYAEQFSPEDIKGMAENAPFLMEKDPSAKIAFERMRENPAKLLELQKAYETVYPGDKVDSNEKAAKAYAILSTQGQTGGGFTTKPYTDKDAEFRRQKQLIDYRAAAQQRVNAARQASTTKEAKSVLNGMMEDLEQEARRNPITTQSADGKREQTYNIPLTEEVAKAGMLPGEKFAPDALRLVEKDGKKYIRRIVYLKEYDKDGYVIGNLRNKDKKPRIDDSKSTLIPFKQFRDKIGKELFTGKLLYNELGQPVQSDNILNDNEPDRPSRKDYQITKEDLENIE